MVREKEEKTYKPWRKKNLVKWKKKKKKKELRLIDIRYNALFRYWRWKKYSSNTTNGAQAWGI